MRYPHVTEITRNGRPVGKYLRTQRELVEHSLRLKPEPPPDRPGGKRGR